MGLDYKGRAVVDEVRKTQEQFQTEGLGGHRVLSRSGLSDLQNGK